MDYAKMIKEKLNAQKALVELAITEQRAMNTDEQKQYDDFDIEISNIEKTIEANKAVEAKTAELKEPVNKIYAQPKDPNEGKFKSSSEFLHAVRLAASPGGTVDKRLFNAASGTNELVPSDGGFLVDTDFAKQLLMKTYDTATVANRTFKVPISANSNSLKINAIDESSRANGSRYGGITMYWEDEAALGTGSKPQFKQISLELKKLMGLCYATDELLKDSTALEALITKAFSEEYAFKLDDACISGTGAGQPLGILKSDALVSVAKETGQTADTIVYENVLKMWSRMWARSRQNAVWYINQDIEPQLNTMSLAVGTGGIPVYLPAGGATATPHATLLGRPVLPIEQCPTLGDVGDIILADMSQYVMIDKGGMESASSIHVRFLYDESVFRFIYRCDGQPLWNSALTPYKGTGNTQSPFVALAERA